jgi:hypothetical protein
MFVTAQFHPLRQILDTRKKIPSHCVVQQAVSVMGKGTMIPRQIVNTQPNKPAVQQPVFDVLDQLPFGTDGKQHLEQRMIGWYPFFQVDVAEKLLLGMFNAAHDSV